MPLGKTPTSTRPLGAGGSRRGASVRRGRAWRTFVACALPRAASVSVGAAARGAWSFAAGGRGTFSASGFGAGGVVAGGGAARIDAAGEGGTGAAGTLAI